MNYYSHKPVLSVLLLSGLLLTGCPKSGPTDFSSEFEAPPQSVTQGDPRKSDNLFNLAIQMLNELEIHEGRESEQRVTGQLNEWIKSFPLPKDWHADPMTPQWLTKAQGSLPQLTSILDTCHVTRSELAQVHTRFLRILELQETIQQISQTSQNNEEELTTAEIEKLQADYNAANEELTLISTSLNEQPLATSIDRTVAALKQLKQFFSDFQSDILIDEDNFALIDNLSVFLARYQSQGADLLNPEQLEMLLLGLQKFNTWLAQVNAELNITQTAFPSEDIRYLKEAVWLSEASEWAQGTNAANKSRVMALFDWTIRNIALESALATRSQSPITGQPSPVPSYRTAGQILLLGRGTAEERAWVFSLLAAQQGLDVVLMRVPCDLPESESVSQPESQPESQSQTEPQPESGPDQLAELSSLELPDITIVSPTEKILAAWLDEDKIYLFDPEYGVPLPAQDGITLPGKDLPTAKLAPSVAYSIPSGQNSENGQDDDFGETRDSLSLQIEPAVLSDLISNPALLRQMDYTILRNNKQTEYRYPITAENLQKAEFLLPVHPLSLSLRMWILESRLTGTNARHLACRPSELKDKITRLVPVAEVSLLDLPFRAIMFCPLRQGESITMQLAPLQTNIGDTCPLRRGRTLHLKGLKTAAIEGDENAVTWYQRARMSDSQLDLYRNSGGNWEASIHAGLYASYWLGLISDADNRHEAAIDYFSQVFKPGADNIWSQAALYNISRVWEELGVYQKSIMGYEESDRRYPLVSCNAIRAQWLKNEIAPSENVPAENAPAENAPAENAPAENAPAENVPAENAPAENAPAENVPSENAPSENAPTENVPAENVPAENAPSENAPSENADTENAPTENTGVAIP